MPPCLGCPGPALRLPPSARHCLAPMGVERGAGGPSPLDFEIISKKRLFFQFRGVKNKFHHFYPPWKKFWEIHLLTPREKILPTPMLPPGKIYADAHK